MQFVGLGVGEQAVGPAARELARELGLSLTMAELLIQRGQADPDDVRRFLDPKLSELTLPDGMADRQLAADRLRVAIAGGERIAVFGDYDCDGITAAAVMTEVLRALGGKVSVLLASRFGAGTASLPRLSNASSRPEHRCS